MAGMRDFRAALRRFAGAQGGNFALMFAISLPMLVGTAAFMVDEAALYYQRRAMQTAVDLAAIHAAGNPGPALERARLALADSRQVAQGPSLAELESHHATKLQVEAGRYVHAPALPVDQRFTPAIQPADAVRISLARQGQLFFFRGLFPPPVISVRATANASARAAFSIGSRLASLEGGMANALLNALLGINASAGVMSYSSLLDADVAVFGVLDALAGRLNLTTGTYDQLLASEFALADLVAASASAASGNSALAAQAIASATAAHLRLRGNRLIDLGPLGAMTVGTAEAGLAGSVGVLELIGAAASVANGRNQAQLALALAVPGLTLASLAVAIGEPAQGSGWLGVGREQTRLRTAQTRLRLTVTVAGSGLLAGASIRLPIYLEVAGAEASLTTLACPPGQPPSASATIAARPGLVRLVIGETSDTAFTSFAATPSHAPAQMVSVLGAVRIAGNANVEIAQAQPVPLRFSAADAATGTVRTVSTRTPAQSLTASLLSGLDVNVTLLGPNALNVLLRPAYEAAVRTALAPLAPLIDGLLVAALEVSGVGLGEADVRLLGFDCRQAALVQ